MPESAMSDVLLSAIAERRTFHKGYYIGGVSSIRLDLGLPRYLLDDFAFARCTLRLHG